MAFSSRDSIAQDTPIDLGISWDVPETVGEISAQLSFYQKIGVRFIELKHPIKHTILDSLAGYPFQVLIRFDKKFLTTSEVHKNRDEIVHQYSSLILEYAEHEQVIAYGLYAFSQSFNSEFIEEFESITSELSSQISNREFYEITSGPFNALDFSLYEIENEVIPENISGFLFSKSYQKNDQYILKDIFEQSPRLLFLDSNWLQNALSNYAPLQKALLDYVTEGEFILPLPQKEPPPVPFNWSVLVFLIIWISMGVHVAVSQTYKPLIFRYYTGHRFFVDDVMRYRERSYLSGIFLFLQHAAFTGLVTYILSSLLISSTGLDALYTTIPHLAFFGKNYFSLFAIGGFLGIIIQLIALVWLYFPNKAMTHFSQALSLFTWVWHLDFLIVSVMLILLLTGGSSNLILLLGFLFVINWLVAFFVTSLDSSKYLMQKRVSYMLYTFGIHSLVNIGLLILIFSSDFIMDLVELVVVL